MTQTKELAVKKNQSLVTGSMTREQIDLIKKTVAIGATDDELKMFLYTSNRTGLDPLARQIYFLKRKVWNKSKNAYDEKVSIQSSIDGFRVVAERSGDYAGQDEPEFEEDNQGRINVCKVKVYRFSKTGERYPASVGVAYWDEYCPQQGQDFMWRKMPHTMLSKVAEALALRKAFPQDLSGLYTGDEMEQSGISSTTPVEAVKAVKTTNAPPAPVQAPQQSRQAVNRPIRDEDIPVIEADEPIGQPNGIVETDGNCPQCGGQITPAERSYSLKMYKSEMCRGCQREFKATMGQ